MSKEETPINRVFPFLLSFTIFGLYYAVKFKKVIVWSFIAIFSNFVCGVVYFMVEYTVAINPKFADPTLTGIIIVTSSLVSILGIMASAYCMYEWSTRHNLSKFGYKSEDEWRKSLSR